MLAAISLPAAAERIYRWTDTAGTIHFSDEPPAQPVADTVSIELPQFAAPRDPANDYYSIVNQSKRMEQSRLAREKLRAEQQAALEKLRLERDRVALQAERQAALVWRYPVSGWGYYRGYADHYDRRHRRHYGHREIVRRYPNPQPRRWHRSGEVVSRGTSSLMPPRGRGISTKAARRTP